MRVSLLVQTFLLLIPFALFAEPEGPAPGLAGVPNEAGNCATCHGSGQSSVNTMGGGVAINFSKGQSYVPGEVQQWIVTITDASARRWGFQAAARKSTSTGTPAGGFVSTDSNTQVVCSSSSLRSAQRVTTGACPSTAPLMYVEQTLAGTRLGTTGSITFQFNWTAPATDVGPVTVYISANAANGNNADDANDHVYTATYTLNPSAPAGSGTPAISQAGVVNGASFAPGISAGSWVTIQGANFTTATNCDSVNNPQPGCRTWTAADFTNGTPVSLDGVSVTMAGKPAYVYYVSPTQINVQAPDIGTGSVDVTVTNANGTSNSVPAVADSFAPAFFLAGRYAIATHTNGSLVAPEGTFPGSSPAQRGETIVLWGTGFGPVAPSVPPGSTPAQALGATTAYASTAPAISIGGVPATVVGAALNPSALGLYQVAITLPAAVASGEQVVVAEAGGKSSPASGVVLAVQ